jgi:hypothetical protein
METSTIISSLGIVLDIIGVFLLFIYQPPTPATMSQNMFMETASIWDRFKFEFKSSKISKRGLLLILFGFILQLVGNFI